MIDLFSHVRDWVRGQYHHGITAALGLGWVTQAADVGSKLLGLLAIAIGIVCSVDKLRRDRQLHGVQMRQALAPRPVTTEPDPTGGAGLRVYP